MPFESIETSNQRPEDVYSGLRDQILSLKASEIGLAPSSQFPMVWGAIMETGYPPGVVTLVCLADRTTSVYVSNGGGVIGAGEHEAVAAATAAFLSMANEFHAQMEPATTFPLPGVGRVRFYLLTFSGVLTAEANEQDLGHMRHPLAPLFHEGHKVLGNIRIHTQQ